MGSSGGMNREQRLLSVMRRWYAKNARILPWRTTRVPYEVWVSEVLLQQTQVARGEGYYRRFLKRFPSLSSLARAPWSDVLEQWRGLGYYQRARNMHETAKIVALQMHRRFPREIVDLRKLPGIGEYTATALHVFCFDGKKIASDVNVVRVVGRVFAESGRGIISRIRSLEERHSVDYRDLTQALMDLGATVCRAQSPRCSACPCESFCLSAHRTIAVKRFKDRKPQSRRSGVIDVGCACIHKDGRYLFGLRSRKKGGGWEFPGGKREARESIRACIKREVWEELGIEVSVRPAFHIQEVSRKDTRLRLHFCRAQILEGYPRVTEHLSVRWIAPKDFDSIPVLSTNAEALEILRTRY